MASEKLDEKAIFNVARKIDFPDARAEYLHQVCGADQNLFERVETLLRAYEEQASFLESPPAGSAPPTRDQPPLEQPGTVIGPYKLLEKIGEGGMGVVFMAEQQEPVVRKVALKVIKPGMDTRQVIARFGAEQQALAVMDHPSIARVLDAGATDSGRPYFVMELVRGVPITTYCDENNLPVRERLELFASVCQAIQHAHTKGIVHRDIKPSNVLVTRQDGRATVKVIDFGVAKALGQQLTEKTLFTNFAQMIGTPLYMSPEQAERSGVDIDTRSDIYSLGVLLYELLTGSTPVDAGRMKQAAFDEVRRIIREDEPQTPSARLSGSHTLPAIAAQRHIEPARLSRLVRGELDWIVMKALEKDRSRRYETANAFAADLLHYLHDEAVQACPPSATYRFGKFARRNRVAITTATLVALALVLGTIVSTWQAIRAETARVAEVQQRKIAEAARSAEATQRKAADNQRAQAQQQREVAEHERAVARASFQQAQQAVDDYFTTISESELLKKPGMESLRKDLLESAVKYYQTFVAQHADDPALRAELAAAHIRLGRIYHEMGSNQWIEELQHVVEIVEPLVEQGADISGWKGLREGLLFKDHSSGPNDAKDTPKKMLVVKRIIPIWEKLARDHPDIPGFACDLASLQMIYAAALNGIDKSAATLIGLDKSSWTALVISTFQQAVANWQRFPSQVRGTHRQFLLGNASFILAGLHSRDGNWEDAYRYASLAVQTFQDVPWQTAAPKVNHVEQLEAAYSELGKAAIALNRREEARQVIRVPNNDEQSAVAHHLLARAFERLNDLDNALAEFTRSIELCPDRNFPFLFTILEARGKVQRKMGRLEEAEADFRAAIEVCSQLLQDSPGIEWRYWRARAYAELRLHDQALADVGYGPRDPEKFKPYHMQTRAEILFDAHRIEQAVDDLERALKDTPDHPLLHGTRGSALIELKRYDQAIEEFTRAIELDTNRSNRYGKNWSRRGWVASVQGRFEDAQRDFEEGVSRDQSNVLALRRLAWFLATCPDEKYRDAARAVTLAEQAASFNPHNGVFWYTLGVAQYRAGKYDEALKACRRALDMRDQPYSPLDEPRVATDYDHYAGFFLAMTQWQLGEKEKARETFEAAVAWTKEHAPDDEQLARFQKEAAELLGVETP
jgi:serine/threonine protein kinase/tetratricopeptide (TPR) repeat protein